MSHSYGLNLSNGILLKSATKKEIQSKKNFAPGKDEEQEGHDEVGDYDVDPDVEGKRVHEGEQLGWLLRWLSSIQKLKSGHEKKTREPVKDADAESHERV